MTLKHATDLVILCENLFGCVSAVADGTPVFRMRSIEAGKINRAMAKDPMNITLDNLELAANYCFQKRIPIKTPYGLVFKIPQALDLVAAVEPTSDLAESVQRALAWEADNPDDFSGGWAERLTRAHGDARGLLLKDWHEASRG